MSQEQAIQFLQQGIAAAKAKQNEQARKLLQNAIRLDPRSETAWLWLSSVAKDNNERVFCLRQLLAINPQHEMALKGLRAMGVTAAPDQDQEASEEAVVDDDSPSTASRPAGIPMPALDKIARAQAALDPILRRVMLQLSDVLPDIEWVHKRRRRAGERRAFLYRLGIIFVPLLVLVFIGGLVVLLIASSPETVAFLAGAPTWTVSPTPTNTATPTAGFTPTPSLTPAVPHTLPPPFRDDLPQGNIDVEATATPIYPRPEGNPMREAIALLDMGRYSEALPILTRERELTEAVFDPVPYFYESIARAETGDATRAIELLQEGLDRADDPLLHAGLAYVYAYRGEYRNSNTEAETAIRGDSQLRWPYLIMAQNGIATGNFQETANAINRGVEVLPGEVELWLLQGKLNLARNQPAEAQYDASVALYINPYIEEPYQLRARADITRGDYGSAVLNLQEYLFYYPGSVLGWAYLGQARASEGNTDLALMAYDQALNTEDPLPQQYDAYVGRANVYMGQGQFALAYQDFNAAVGIDGENPIAREGRIAAAYRAGRYAEVVEDVDVLLAGDDSRDDLRLVKAQALVDDVRSLRDDARVLLAGDDGPELTEAEQTALDDALDILGRLPDRLSGPLRAEAYEYRARVYFAQGRDNDALQDVNRALQIEENGSRYFLLGMIEQTGDNEEEARLAYEWVQQWTPFYNYPFLAETIELLRMIEPG